MTSVYFKVEVRNKKNENWKYYCQGTTLEGARDKYTNWSRNKPYNEYRIMEVRERVVEGPDFGE